MPTFPSGDCRIDDIHTKSWGVYVTILPNTTQTCSFKASAGERIAVSASVPPHVGTVELTASLYGHNAAAMTCLDGFTGWNVQSSRHLRDAGLDSELFLNLTAGDVELEPFGVGLYRPLFACDTNAPPAGDDHYEFRVTNRGVTSIPVSFGVGMEEDFSFPDLVRMPYTIYQTWVWADASFYVYGLPPITATIVAVVVVYVLFQQDKGVLCMVDHVAGLFLLSNAMSFTARLIELKRVSAVPIVIHITLPLILATVMILKHWVTWPCPTRDTCGQVATFVPLLGYAGLMAIPSLRWPFGILIGLHVIAVYVVCTSPSVKDAFLLIIVERVPMLLYSLLFLWQGWWVPSVMCTVSLFYISAAVLLKRPAQASSFRPMNQKNLRLQRVLREASWIRI